MLLKILTPVNILGVCCYTGKTDRYNYPTISTKSLSSVDFDDLYKLHIHTITKIGKYICIYNSKLSWSIQGAATPQLKQNAIFHEVI